MRKLMMVAVIVIMAWAATVATPGTRAHQFNPPQTAGDVGPGGG